MKSLKTATLVLATAGLITAGCTADPAPAPTVTETTTVTATETVTATPAPAPAELGISESGTTITAPIVADVDDLRAQLEDVGLICSDWEPIADGIGGTCSGGILLNAFEDSEDGNAFHRSSVNLALTAITTQRRADVALLVGPNWFVRADIEGAYVLRDLIGGTVVGTAPSN